MLVRPTPAPTVPEIGPPDLFGVADSEDVVRYINKQGGYPLHLCIAGSHMWGLNKPDSDLDVRGIYLKPIQKVLGLRPGDDWLDPVQAVVNEATGAAVDFQLWELGKALRLLCAGNGNAVQQLLAPTTFYTCQESWSPAPPIDLVEIAHRFLTRELARYYKGYYQSQRRRAMENRGGKALAYSYRELYEGIHVMHFGEIEFNFVDLRAKLEDARLVPHSAMLDHYLDRNSAAWTTPVGDEQLHAFEAEWNALTEIMNRETDRSPLPKTYPTAEEDMDEALWRVRRWQAAHAIAGDLAAL